MDFGLYCKRAFWISPFGFESMAENKAQTEKRYVN